VPWVIVSAIAGARLMHVVFYEPSVYLSDPLQIFLIHHGGLSSTGGILGGVLALSLWLQRSRLTKAEVLAFFDALAVAFLAGFAVGRLGCYAAHHHLSEPLSGPHLLGTVFPDGLWRIDLGLMEAVSCAVLFSVFTWLRRALSGLKAPFFLGLTLLLYGALRLILDLFRADNLRYAYLTPAQWVGVGMIGCGAVCIAHCLRRYCQKSQSVVA